VALQNEKKAAIRERYKGVDPSLLEVIPATAPETMAVEDRTLNVAAYIRVSTDNDEQTSSFELQRMISRSVSRRIPSGTLSGSTRTRVSPVQSCRIGKACCRCWRTAGQGRSIISWPSR